MQRLTLSLCFLLLLTGCESTTQVTSGEEYLDRHGVSASATMEKALNKGKDSAGFQEQLRQAAAIEPTLTFPARIGIARLATENQSSSYRYSLGKIVPIPQAEGQEWVTAAEKLGKDYGEFIPLNPMIAEMFSETAASEQGKRDRDSDTSETIIKQIRLAAARQHLDAVLIYQVVAKHSRQDNLLTIGNATILGGFLLPSKTLEAEGYATAMLIDVMQAYPYGTVTAYANDMTAYSSSWGWGDKYGHDLITEIEENAVGRLATETGTMLEKLRKQLVEVQAKKQTKKIPAKQK